MKMDKYKYTHTHRDTEGLMSKWAAGEEVGSKN